MHKKAVLVEVVMISQESTTKDVKLIGYFSTNQIAWLTNFDQSENGKKFFMFSILLL